MLIGGHGGRKEIERGLALCKRAADEGDPDAQTDYGGYLLTGKHLPKDARAALHYLGQAATKRQPNAAYLVGQIYWNGDGVGKDNGEAAKWWKVAHEAGRPDAASMLAGEIVVRIVEFHRRDKGIPVALVDEAISWFSLAEKADPNPNKRSKASEMLGLMRKLRLEPKAP